MVKSDEGTMISTRLFEGTRISTCLFPPRYLYYFLSTGSVERREVRCAPARDHPWAAQRAGPHDAAVDEETGDISIADSVLFDEGRFALLDDGKNFLNRFIPVYSEVIFSNELIEEEIVRVVMEGHTSSLGFDHTNMELSLNRANSVANYIITEMEFSHKERFIQKMQASGRGEIDADQSIDNAADRRVMFRFKFKGEDFGEWKRRAEEGDP